MAHTKTPKIESYTLAGEGRDEGIDSYIDLRNRPGIKIVRESDFGFGGTGQVVRVVDYVETRPDLDTFVYRPPIN